MINCFDYRFSKAAMPHSKEIEAFLLSKTKACSSVAEFYKDDFDPQRLILDRNMMLDAVSYTHLDVYKRQNSVCCSKLCWKTWIAQDCLQILATPCNA